MSYLPLKGSHQRHKELWRLSYLSTQRQRPALDGFHVQSRIVPGGYQYRAQSGLPEQLVLNALGESLASS